MIDQIEKANLDRFDSYNNNDNIKANFDLFDTNNNEANIYNEADIHSEADMYPPNRDSNVFKRDLRVSRPDYQVCKV